MSRTNTHTKLVLWHDELSLTAPQASQIEPCDNGYTFCTKTSKNYLTAPGSLLRHVLGSPVDNLALAAVRVGAPNAASTTLDPSLS